MGIKTVIGLGALAAVLGLAACGGPGASPAACHSALSKEWAHQAATVFAGGSKQPHFTIPATCHGLSAQQMERIVGEVLTGK